MKKKETETATTNRYNQQKNQNKSIKRTRRIMQHTRKNNPKGDFCLYLIGIKLSDPQVNKICMYNSYKKKYMYA